MAKRAQQYAIRTDAGSIALPCTGTVSYENRKIGDDFMKTFVEIQYFSGEACTDDLKVQPTAGTCTCDGAYSERFNWLELLNGVADATTSESSTRTEPPSGHGPLVGGRVTFDGVTGATHAIVVFHKHAE